jgi:hypothetical protein
MRARPLMRARHGLDEDAGRRPFDALGFRFHDLFERYAVEIGTGAAYDFGRRETRRQRLTTEAQRHREPN